MGLFDLFKKKEKPQEIQESKILLAMPMFKNGDRYELSSIVEDLKNFWGLKVASVDGDNDSAVLMIDGEMVAIAYLPVHIPSGDIEGTAQYAYNWLTALDDLKDLSGHSIVTLMKSKKTTVDRFRLFSKVLCSILSTSNAVGIYQGMQSLLIPKDQYLDNREELKNDGTPVFLWIYIGIRKSESGNSVYTYGLTEFGKQEMEVIDSALELEDLADFISNIASYVISSDVTFKSGETLGYTAEQKIKITSSKGRFVEGQSLKLDM